MKNLTKRIFSLALALIMCFGIVAVGAETVYAAEVPTVTITPLVTDSVNKQAFEVNIPQQNETYTLKEALYSTDGGVNYAAMPETGNTTMTFDTSATINLKVVAKYANASGSIKNVVAEKTSINAYRVFVSFVTEDNLPIPGEEPVSILLSKYDEPEVTYNAPAVISQGEIEYRPVLSSTIVLKYGDGNRSIKYAKETKAAKTVTVKYVDASNNVDLYTEPKTLSFGDPALNISAPATYTKDGSNYALKSTASYNVTYENAQSVYTFEYTKQAPAAQLPYDITVNLVDENGTQLHSMKKSIDVGATATVELPATYVVGLKTYKLADGQAAAIVREYASAESKTYTVKYVLSGETAAETVTINFVDQASGKTLDTLTATVEPDGAPFTYDISSKNYVEKNGVTYQVLAGQGNSKGKIVHAYGDSTKTYNLYYSAKLEKNPESYAVSMRYICVNDNKVLSTETKIVKVNSSVTFESAPKTLKVAGKEYILLNGQNAATVHKYNDAQTNYEIYYRDASIKVENNDIIYVPGTNVDQGETSQPTTPGDTTVENNDAEEPQNQQTTVPGAVTETEDEETAEPTTGEEDEEETSEAVGEIEESEESSAPGEEVEIIEEDEVPLADKPLDAAEENSSAAPYVIGGIGLLAIIVLAVLFIVKKRRTA